MGLHQRGFAMGRRRSSALPGFRLSLAATYRSTPDKDKYAEFYERLLEGLE
jgi:hypothetical protein